MEEVKAIRADVEQYQIKEIFKDVFKYAPSKICGSMHRLKSAGCWGMPL